MNVASPHLDIPITIFYFGTLRKYPTAARINGNSLDN